MVLEHAVQQPRETEEGRKPPCLILLHGVRSNEQDLLGLTPMLDGRFFAVSARAPIVMGPSAFGWYHVQFRPDGFLINEEEAASSLDTVLQFIAQVKETYPIDSTRVFLMGFSQGCIMSIGAALAQPRQMAGVVGMSGRVIESTLARIAPHEHLTGLPMYVVHGTRDEVISIEHGRQIRQVLEKLPVELTYREYDMAHHVTRESLADIAAWLTERLDRKTE